MEPKPSWKTKIPVVAFALCVLMGWIASALLDDLLLPLVGIVGGLAVGDLVDAIFRPPEPAAGKRIGKPH